MKKSEDEIAREAVAQLKNDPDSNRARALLGLVAEVQLYDFICIAAAVVASTITFCLSLAEMTKVLFCIIVGVGIVLRYGLRTVVLTTWGNKRLDQIDKEFPPEP